MKKYSFKNLLKIRWVSDLEICLAFICQYRPAWTSTDNQPYKKFTDKKVHHCIIFSICLGWETKFFICLALFIFKQRASLNIYRKPALWKDSGKKLCQGIIFAICLWWETKFFICLAYVKSMGLISHRVIWKVKQKSPLTRPFFIGSWNKSTCICMP